MIFPFCLEFENDVETFLTLRDEFRFRQILFKLTDRCDVKGCQAVRDRMAFRTGILRSWVRAKIFSLVQCKRPVCVSRQVQGGQSMGRRRNFGLAMCGAPLNGGLLQDRIAFVRISLSLVTACLYIAIGTYSCEARLLVPWYKTIGTQYIRSYVRTYVASFELLKVSIYPAPKLCSDQMRCEPRQLLI